MTDAYSVPPTRRVDLWFAGTSPQNRWTVGFRIILAIPQFIVLYFLFIATVIVVIIGWFGALFMGRLPAWVHEFVAGVVRWATRVGAYMFLLTDRYPPFSLEDEAYPARPFIPAPGPLNRWTVLFRIFIAIPASVFYQIVQYGLTFPLLLGVWIAVLVTGTMPAPLYLAYAALLRYETRFHSWFAMLTAEYPWGMLGDRMVRPPAFPPPSAVPPPGPAAPPPSAPAPPAPAPAPGVPAPGAPPAPYAYPTGEPAPAAPPPPPPAAPPPAAPAPAAPPPAAPPPAAPPPAAPPPAAPPFSGPGGVPPGPMPPPPAWERAVPPDAGTALPPWGTLVLEGAARGWMIFAIVWGSILFVTQDATQTFVGGNNQNNTGQYVGVHRGPAVGAEGHARTP